MIRRRRRARWPKRCARAGSCELTGPNGFLIVAERSEGHLAPIGFELLGVGRGLATAAGEPLLALLIGTDEQAAALGVGGADRVHLLDEQALEPYVLETRLAALERAVREIGPRAVLLGHTSTGRDLAPRLAIRLGVGLTTDATSLAYDRAEGVVVATRPVFGGLVISEQVPRGQPQVITVRPKTQEPAAVEPGRVAEVLRLAVELSDVTPRTRVLDRVKVRAGAKRLEDAEVVVAGGRGIGGPEGFRLLEELAEVLGGVVGASRVAADAGWVSSDQQVGLTGKITSPKLYVAVGISGAMQHMAGCATARTIVAINTDPDAAIFEKAHFGIVGDYRTVVPALTDACRALRAT